MRKIAAIITCSLILVCFLSTSVLAAYPYITLDPSSRYIISRYYGSFMQYQASISGKMNKDHEKAYLRTNIYENGVYRGTSGSTCMWGYYIPAKTPWVDKQQYNNFSAKAYGHNFQEPDYLMSIWYS